MIKTCSAMLLGALMMFGARADAATVQFGFNGLDYDIATVTGTFDDLSAILQDQVWWGDSTTAVSFASAVGTQLGTPAENTGLTFSNWAPLFAVAVNGSQVSSIAQDVAGVFGFTIQGPTSNISGTHTYAVASTEMSPVPLPATAWMFLAALGAMFCFKRLRAT